ncbi:MAG: hypothetical protein KAT05_04425 [Spirochaetes bacterium]|nr:hypothetical protein [Spirochaetota bacterium]
MKLLKYKKLFFLIFLILPNLLYSTILSDLTKDHTITIKIYNKDLTRDATEDITFGNKWYSRQNIFICQTLEMGISGTKDYLSEQFFIKYRFRSKNKHAFAIRLSHIGYAPGLFSNNFTFYNFGIFAGFEYFFKVFSSTEGFFVWTDIGGCNEGFAFDLGLGIGSRVKNGFELWLAYLHNVGIFSRLEFYFLIFNILTLRGKMGLDIKYYNLNMEIFTFIGGFYVGVFIKNTFRIELGGGFTLNDYSYFRGFGGINIAFQFL